ncbi:hypothetical protein OG874_21355 [Nocardia sp. NBC_00565]|uniref:hypothetical protein n=1 Tax=Nocardia sp. NBC_00565 TaxID=2975993 RepID=UPI002E809756|nr:hypothetical protein [Nocardia sp. NBC_00565]WUC07476.1 hypothetical protein OG874_21355 [Nocardia sp. NBC_00565]
MTSRAFKGESDPAGIEATWIIGEPGSRAIAVLEKLQGPGIDILFRHLNHRNNKIVPAMSIQRTNSLINEVVNWVNTYCAEHGRTDGIPQIASATWKLTTRQFRRTFACKSQS